MTETKVCSKCGISKRVTEYSKHSGQKSGLRPDCKECYKLTRRKHYEINKNVILNKNKEWLLNNPDKKNQYISTYISGTRKEYLKSKREHLLPINRFYSAKHRFIKNRNTPLWANEFVIKQIYLDCHLISEMTGIKHHVDHIIPLKGKKVSGLHVENNLRIIPASENLIKSSKLIEELL